MPLPLRKYFTGRLTVKHGISDNALANLRTGAKIVKDLSSLAPVPYLSAVGGALGTVLECIQVGRNFEVLFAADIVFYSKARSKEQQRLRGAYRANQGYTGHSG